MITICLIIELNMNPSNFDSIRHRFDSNSYCLFVLPYVKSRLVNIHFDLFIAIEGKKFINTRSSSSYSMGKCSKHTKFNHVL